MCTDEEPFTTIVGPRRSVERLLEIFPKTMVAARHDLISPPMLVELAEVRVEGASAPGDFLSPESPAVAVVFHEGSSSFAVAAELQAELLVGHLHHGLDPMPDLLCEPGYQFVGAATGQGLNVTLHANALARLQSTTPNIPHSERATGDRVAVLDTGVEGTGTSMVDFTVVPPNATSWDDANGHGTAVADVIRTLRPAVDLHPLRVLGPTKNTGPSYRVLAGVAYALWSGVFDIVNASLTSTTGGPCEMSLGTSIAYIFQTCRNKSPNPVPVVVAAAGNDSSKSSGYPALLPGAIVAMALEEDPVNTGTFTRATYNSKPPRPAREQEAFGGSQSDPIGALAVGNGPTEPLYGTSFAAAAITAAYLP